MSELLQNLKRMECHDDPRVNTAVRRIYELVGMIEGDPQAFMAVRIGQIIEDTVLNGDDGETRRASPVRAKRRDYAAGTDSDSSSALRAAYEQKLEQYAECCAEAAEARMSWRQRMARTHGVG